MIPTLSLRIRLLAALCLSLAALAGQTPSSAPQAPAVPASNIPDRRWSLGGVVSFNALNMVKGGSWTYTQSSPVFEMDVTGTSGAPRFGGGFVFDYRLSTRYTLVANAVYRRSGYQTETTSYLGTDNSATTTDERDITKSNSRTRCNYWDFPLLLRYDSSAWRGWRKRFFYEGGVSLRSVHDVRTSTGTANPDGTGSYDETPAALSRSFYSGVTVGGGWRYKDEFGVKLTPEVRYTRWFGSAFAAPPISSAKDQLEVTLSITF